MDVGIGLIFQGTDPSRSDREVYEREIGLGILAEGLGFQSVWGVEHHFTDYTMCPDVLQLLSHLAGRTERMQLGSMVVVLPWHDPLRVAEQVAMLDNLSGGRLILGLGRGLGRVEFEGFGIDMSTSRGRFVEYADMLLNGLESGFVEYDGQYLKQVRREIRPRPFKSFRGRTYAAAVSPESSELMAKLGIGLLIIPQKPWEVVAQELETYRQIYRRVNGADAPAPIVGAWVYCHEDEDVAREMAVRYIGGYWQTVVQHYELVGDHLKGIQGYESYARFQELASTQTEAMIEFFMSIQVWGTPDQCYEKILEIRRISGANAFNGVFSYAGMPWDAAEANLKLFARQVMPRLQSLEGASPAVVAGAAS